ncbi:MAG: polysaccharide biosynthesis C-terminal domain-containing protein [Sedimentisphaerales bacterium]
MNNVESNPKIFDKLKEDFRQGRTLLTFTTLQTTGAILRMAAPLVVAWLFSESMWNRYSLCEPVIFFFSALLILSAKTPFIIFANQERNETGVIRKTFSIQCIFLATSVSLFLFVIGVFGTFIASIAKIDRIELIFLSLAFFGFVIKDFASNLFMALNRRTANAILEFSFGTLTLAFIAMFYFLKWIDLKTIFLSYFFASLLVLGVTLLVIDFKVLSPLVFDYRQFREMLDFTLWMIAGTVSSTVIGSIGLYALRYFAASMENAPGTYNLAYKFFKGFTILIYIIPSYFLPHISANIRKPEKMRAYLFHKRPLVLFLGVTGFALAWIFMPYFLNLFYHNKYDDVGFLLRIFLIGNVVFLYTAMYGPILGALKIYKFQQIVALSQLVVNFVLSLLLIPRFNLVGAALATVLSYFYLAIVYEYYYRKKLKRLVLQR